MKKQPDTFWMFVISIAIAGAIFLAGVLLGWTLDQIRESDILENIKYNELDTESYLIEKNFLEVFGVDECEVLRSRLWNLKYNINQIGLRLQDDSKKDIKTNLDYSKRKYFLAEMKLLILLQDLNKRCNEKYLPIVFFYTKDDSRSDYQGLILTWINERYEEKVAILSFDRDYLDEPLINTFRKHYNITETSTLIINEQKFDDFLNKDALVSIIEERI